MGVTIKEAQLVEELKGSDKLPISDGSNIPKSVSVEQIKIFANKGVKTPTKVSELENDSEFTTKKELEEAISSIPIPDVSGQISEALVDYVKKVEGKGLSTNDFTNELKEKLEGITPYDPSELEAEISKLETSLNTLVSGNASNAIESFNEIIAFLNNVSDKETLSGIIAGINTRIAEVEGKIPTKVSELTNDNGYLTEHQDISHLATKNELKSKQDVISDLANIREGAAKGATAIQEEQYKGTIAAVDTDESVDDPNIPSGSYDDTEIKKQIAGLASEVERKQENLVSGQNIKTINGKSLLGEGNIEIERGSSYDDTELKNQITDLETEVSKKADESETASKLSELGSKVEGLVEHTHTYECALPPQRKVLPSYGILRVKTKEDDTLNTWPVDKDTKHYCTYEYKDQFSEFSGYAVVKYQGSFSLNYVKKGYRIDFYTDENFTEKKNIKFGGLIETNSYNLKGYYTDITICRDPLINRLYKQAKEMRGYQDMYPWSKNTPIYSCATGACDGFPCVLYINDEFIGLQHLMLKKEAANFNLFNELDGLLYCCDSTSWKREGDDNNGYGEWDSEFKKNDETRKDQFFLQFFDFINSQSFTKENAPQYLNVQEWIDYIIFVEAFWLWDNLVRNIIVYTDDFVKVTPFLYDLDNSFGCGPKAGLINESPLHTIGNVGWMNRFVSMFYKEINARFKELVDKGVLSYQNVKSTLIEMQKGIPYSYLQQDLIKYNRDGDNYLDTNSLLDWYANRLEYLKERFNSKPKEYVLFADDEVENVLAANIGDGVGVTLSEINLVTNFKNWFQFNKSITSFDEFGLFNGTEVIETSAFQDCINLKSIVFPNGIKQIRSLAFGGCDALVIEDLSLPNVEDIYDNTFVRVKVKKVSNLGSVSKIGINCFGNCTELEEVVLPSTATKLSDRAFNSCRALRTINLDPNINSIGFNTFYDCQSLYIEDLSLPNLTTLGSYAFAGCKIQKITNLGLITSIPERVFFKNTELKTIDISEHVTSLGSHAFMDCKAVEYFIFRSSTPPTLGGWAIDDTISTPIYVPDSSVEAYKAADGWGSYVSRIKPLSEYVA